MSVTRKPVSKLVGKKFNRLTVVDYLGKRSHGKHWWKCKCDCGNFTEGVTSSIKNGYLKSCGCLRKEKLSKNRADPTKHGLHKHNLYSIYYGMLQRCYNPNNCRYYCYGNKGIKVCEEWKSDFLTFYQWATKNGYEKGLSIDRIDPENGYNPDNCQWLTRAENTRRRYD